MYSLCSPNAIPFQRRCDPCLQNVISVSCRSSIMTNLDGLLVDVGLALVGLLVSLVRQSVLGSGGTR